ncbi:MAG: protein kinase domain-containing protein [Planctomycetales bacterium]
MIGRFQVLELLGRGAFGEVYKARDPELDRLVAVKIPRSEYFATPEEEQRFLREARSAANLRHPGIVQVHEIAHEQGLPYIVSDYIEGLTLADLISGGRPGFRDSAEMVAQLADALDHAHRQKVIHRDIKPSNILLATAPQETTVADRTTAPLAPLTTAKLSPFATKVLPPLARGGRGGRAAEETPPQFTPYLTDFGLARRDEGEITVTLDGQILGTPAYMSPEQAAGDHARVDGRSDVYSLGVVLYELLSGELPFRGSRRMLLHQVLHDDPRPPRSLNDQIPRDLETICLKAMAKEPSRRYATAGEFAAELRRLLRGDTIRARPVGRIERSYRWTCRNPILAAASCVALVALALTGVVSTLFAVYHAQTSRDLTKKADDLTEALKISEGHRISAKERTARVLFERALRDLDKNDADTRSVLFQLCDALGAVPPEAVDLEVTIRLIMSVIAQSFAPRVRLPYLAEREKVIAFSPDGQLVAVRAPDGLRVCDLRTGRSLSFIRTSFPEFAEFAIDNRRMAVQEDATTIAIWNLDEDAQPLRRIPMRTSQKKPIDARFSPNGQFVALDFGFSKEIWDAAGTTDKPTIGRSINGGLQFLCADGETIVVRNKGDDWFSQTWWGKELDVINLNTGRPPNGLVVEAGQIVACAATRDGRLVVTGGEDGAIRFWTRDWQTAMPGLTLDGRVESVHLSSDENELLFSTSNEIGTIGLANGTRGSQIAPARGLHLSMGFAALHNKFAWVGIHTPTELSLMGGPSGFQVELFLGTRNKSDGPFEFVSLGRQFLRDSTSNCQILRHDHKVHVTPVSLPLALQFSEESFWVIPKEAPKIISPIAVGGSAETIRMWSNVITCCRLDADGRIEELSEAEWDDLRLRLEKRAKEDLTGLLNAAARDRLRYCRMQVYEHDAGTITQLNRLIEEEPEDGGHYRMLADLLAGVGDFGSAASDLIRSRELDTTHFKAMDEWRYSLICLAGEELSAHRESREDLRLAREKSSLFEQSRLVLLYGLGPDGFSPVEPLIPALEQTVWDDAEKNDIRVAVDKALAIHAIRVGNSQQAISLVTRFMGQLKLDVMDVRYCHLLLALAFQHAGDSEASLTSLSKALTTETEDGDNPAAEVILGADEFIIRREIQSLLSK